MINAGPFITFSIIIVNDVGFLINQYFSQVAVFCCVPGTRTADVQYQRFKWPQAFRLGTGMRRWPFSRCTASMIDMLGSQDESRVALATTLRFGSAS